jgi:alkanesulfonate monooxygenase SsuD/methylene tetrahydromethanopterin reductase-like flavin-dependent oxidoreductase (luciferase family)
VKSSPDFGLVLSQIGAKWDHVVADAEAAEAGGLDGVWLVDHLLAVFREDGEIFESWTVLSAVAALTERVRLGHLVNNVAFRNVGLFAKQAATLDRISGGRLEIGLGAGWYEREFRAFGFDFGSPGDRRRAFGEYLEALGLLLDGGPVDYHGDSVNLEGAYCFPKPLQEPRPPVTVGAGGPVMIRLAGELADVWNCPSGLLPELPRLRAIFLEAAAGRPVRTTIQVPVAVGRTREEADAALAVGKSHLAWMGDLERVGIFGTIDEASERVARYRAQGVDGFVCFLPGSRRRPDFIGALSALKAAV